MRLQTNFVAATCLALAVALPAASSNQTQRSRWWRSEPIAKELGLASEQSARIDQIWESTVPELREEWDQLENLEEKLARMMDANVDEAELARQIDRVETARASANKTRSLMLYRMRQVLTPEQRARLKAVQQRRTGRGRQAVPGANPTNPAGGNQPGADRSSGPRL